MYKKITKIIFKGEFTRSLDSGGCLWMPPEFIEALDEKLRDVLVLTTIDSCLWAFPKNYWMINEEKAAMLPTFDENAVKFINYFIGHAVECRITNGRITIPPDLLEIAGIHNKVVLAGGGSLIEIWDKDLWASKKNPTGEDSKDARILFQERLNKNLLS